MLAIGFKKDISLRIIIFLLFVALLIGSVYYYQERMLFCDAAHVFFEVVNNHSLQLSGVYRYGAFITQLFPLLASEVHVPLKAALLLYSMSFNLFFLTVAAILLFRFKNTKLSILFALYFILFVSDTYFWTNNEVHQAMGWLFLMFGIIQNYKQHPKHPVFHFSIVIVLALLSLFTHPLILFVFPFLWIFTILQKDLNPYTKQQIIILSFVFVSIFILKYYTMSLGGYDTEKVRSATHISFSDIWHAFSSPMSKAITERLIKDYFFVPVLFFLGIGAAIFKKKYKEILLVFLFAIPYFLAVCLTYADFSTFYIESEWMPFSIITSALFVYYFAPIIKTQWVIVLLVIVFAVRINLIIHSAVKFEMRKQWVFSVLKEMKHQNINKGYVYMTDSLQPILLINWGGPAESMIASALIGENPTRTFMVENGDNIASRMVKSKYEMMGCFRTFNYDELNKQYFDLDTMQRYQLIRTENRN